MKRLTYKHKEVFDDLTVIDQAPPQNGKQRVQCRCKCGKLVERYLSSLHKPVATRRSCGCAKRKYGSQRKTKSYSGKVFSSLSQRFYLGRPL